MEFEFEIVQKISLMISGLVSGLVGCNAFRFIIKDNSKKNIDNSQNQKKITQSVIYGDHSEHRGDNNFNV